METLVYKYRGPERVNDLRSRTLRLTPPGLFNDPFEALPAVAGAWSPSTLEALVNETHRLAQADGHHLPPELVVHDFDDQNRLAAALGTEWIGKLANELFGIVSFSAVGTDPLMWAHYAADHKGFVVAFDAQHEWFERRTIESDPINHLAHVLYSQSRPRVYLDGASLTGVEGQARWAAAVFGTKSAQWSYEKERRLVVRLEEADVCAGGIHLLRFPADLVREVTFGLRMSYAGRSALLEVLDDPSYGHVRKLQARISADRFDVVTDQL